MDKWTQEDEAQLQELQERRKRTEAEVFRVLDSSGWAAEGKWGVTYYLIRHAAEVRKALEPFVQEAR